MQGGKLKLAVLDMYEDTPNQGMRAIKDIVRTYEDQLDWKVYDVRSQHQIPDLSYDIFICSGGPGDPRVGDGEWDKQFNQLLDKLWKYNEETKGTKKYVFFICHSFQMACHHFQLAKVTERRSRSFGTFPTHKTALGNSEPLFAQLPDPFYVADFRSYQVIQPNDKAFEKMGAEVLSLEKIRPHVDLERAIMAVRFSEEIFGTQFHPEADPQGMLIYFSQEEKKQEIINEHGEEKFETMLADLNAMDHIPLTHRTILPGFIDQAVEALKEQYTAQSGSEAPM